MHRVFQVINPISNLRGLLVALLPDLLSPDSKFVHQLGIVDRRGLLKKRHHAVVFKAGGRTGEPGHISTGPIGKGELMA
jgi:hypothetical protein